MGTTTMMTPLHTRHTRTSRTAHRTKNTATQTDTMITTSDTNQYAPTMLTMTLMPNQSLSNTNQATTQRIQFQLHQSMTTTVDITRAVIQTSRSTSTMELEARPCLDSEAAQSASPAKANADHSAQKSCTTSTIRRFTSHGLRMLPTATITRETPG